MENWEKYVGSDRNVSVYGLRPDAPEEDVRAFFARFGTIEEVSKPTRIDVDDSLFHYNILYSDASEAARAIEEAAQDPAGRGLLQAGRDLVVETYRFKKSGGSS